MQVKIDLSNIYLYFSLHVYFFEDLFMLSILAEYLQFAELLSVMN